METFIYEVCIFADAKIYTNSGVKQMQSTQNPESRGIDDRVKLLMIIYMKLRAPRRRYVPHPHFSLILIFSQKFLISAMQFQFHIYDQVCPQFHHGIYYLPVFIILFLILYYLLSSKFLSIAAKNG